MNGMKEIKTWILFFCLLLAACGQSKRGEEKIVSVTIEPQRYFAEKIAGDKFKINCLVPSGQSPETYDPTPRQMMEVGKSVAYLRIGPIGFEQAWMQPIQDNNPSLRVFDLSEGVDLVEAAEPEEAHDAHAGGHTHASADALGEDGHLAGAVSHPHHHHSGGVDPHIWSSVKGAKAIAQNTRDAFIALDKENEAYYRENYDRLAAEIDSTGRTISDLLAPLAHRTFIIYHPALTYFAQENGLTQLCIEMDGKEPSPAQLKKLVETARAEGARVVFIQQEFDQKNAELIAGETGCRLVRINPLDYNWKKEMIHIAKSLADGQTD